MCPGCISIPFHLVSLLQLLCMLCYSKIYRKSTLFKYKLTTLCATDDLAVPPFPPSMQVSNYPCRGEKPALCLIRPKMCSGITEQHLPPNYLSFHQTPLTKSFSEDLYFPSCQPCNSALQKLYHSEGSTSSSTRALHRFFWMHSAKWQWISPANFKLSGDNKNQQNLARAP